MSGLASYVLMHSVSLITNNNNYNNNNTNLTSFVQTIIGSRVCDPSYQRFPRLGYYCSKIKLHDWIQFYEQHSTRDGFKSQSRIL